MTAVVKFTPLTTSALIPIDIGRVSEGDVHVTINKLSIAEHSHCEDEGWQDVLEGADSKVFTFHVKVESTEILSCHCEKPIKMRAIERQGPRSRSLW